MFTIFRSCQEKLYKYVKAKTLLYLILYEI